MTYTPEYRGYRKALEVTKNVATEWFERQVRDNLLARPSLPEEIRERVADHKIIMTCRVERTVGNVWSRIPDSTREDYFYVWRLPKFGEYGDDRFVVRKNGTINVEKAADLVFGQIRSAITKEQYADVMGQNQALWGSMFNKSANEWGDENNIDLELSKVKVGICTVTLRPYKWKFGMKKNIELVKLRDFVTWAEGVRNQAKEWEA